MSRTNPLSAMIGQTVTFRARIHTIRALSSKLVFLVFRQQTYTIQGVLQVSKPNGEKTGRIDSCGCQE